MAKTVQLSEPAYKALAHNKQKGESFSDVVLRILSDDKDPMALLNLGPMREDFDLDEFRRQMEAEDMTRRRELWGPAVKADKKKE